MLTMATMEGDEAFDTAFLGEAEEAVEERVGDNEFIFLKGCKATKAATVLLRGANEFMLEEAERSVHDAICAVSRTLESNAVVPGGGAVETGLSLHLDEYARTFDSYEQWAIAEYSEALQVIPADEKKKGYRWYGLDLTKGTVRDSVAAGVLEPLVSKLKSLKFATEAAITILRIDDLIKVAPDQQVEGMQ